MIIWDDSRDDLVAEALGCPSCCERRVDELVIHDDETVHCLTCGQDYALTEGPSKEDSTD